MRDYCTLFNMTYAAKGLSLYDSLNRHHTGPFRLFVLPMDQQTYNFLNAELHLYPRMRLLSPVSVMNARIRCALAGRDIAYSCFTMTPWLMHWMLNEFDLQEITYLDADLYFYADPEIAHRERGGSDVAIVPHRFMPHDVARLSPNGWYNVSWVTVRRTPNGQMILARWREQCLQQCDRASCGDQLYLNDWPEILTPSELCVFAHHGVGVAPWNAAAYTFTDGPKIHRDADYQEWPMVFYHFHELKRLAPKKYSLTGYPIPVSCHQHIYVPYLQQLELNEEFIASRSKPCASTT